ncbi:flippase [Pseudoalteromonas sp.]|uniref:flippase n=1 Tax=Pseudoalteromonas sp. TaxID=53249 RepID=UPI0035618A06
MNNKIIFNSALLFIEKFIILALGLVNTLVIARYAGKELFGNFAFIVSTASLFLPFTLIGLNNVCSKYFIKYPKNSHHYLKAALIIRAIFASLAILITFFVAKIYFNDELSPLVVLAVSLQWFNIFTLIEFVYLANQHALKPTTIRVFCRLIAKLTLLFSVLNELPIIYWILAIGCEYLLIALSYIMIYIKDDIHLNDSHRRLFSTCKRLFKKSKWLFLSSIAAVLYLKIDQVMLGVMLSSQDVAYYAAAAKLSEFWYIFPVLLANVFMPKLVNLYKVNKGGYWHLQRKLFLTLSTVALTLTVITYFAAPYIIHLLFGDGYAPSSTILQIHILGCLFIFNRAFISKWLILSNNYPYSLYSHGFGVIINLGLNYLLIPIYGGAGAAIASVAAYFAASFGFMFFFNRTKTFIFKIFQVSKSSEIEKRKLL